ncbi:unnamed protein product [Protopolystoma xenopodis]|uniref:Uncharacterized protein n=1 Tax=Protopolystoma xenopodis TaxID=117903 RepID=A0A448WNF2_9PLAT|nr:unnamed protein product [Protopolystoma xenopodis]
MHPTHTIMTDRPELMSRPCPAIYSSAWLGNDGIRDLYSSPKHADTDPNGNLNSLPFRGPVTLRPGFYAVPFIVPIAETAYPSILISGIWTRSGQASTQTR